MLIKYEAHMSGFIIMALKYYPKTNLCLKTVLTAKPKGEIKSQSEKTDTDKKRERRLKKKNQRVRAKEKEKREAAVEKLKPGLGNKYSKEKAIKMLEKVSKDSNVSLVS